MSTIEGGMVVSIDYVLTGEGGEELDRSPDGQPLTYLHGAHNIVPGLEEALAGKAVGDVVKVSVSPDKGYGPKRKVKPMEIMRSKFPADAEVVKGAQFMAQGPKGEPMPVWVSKVQGRTVYVTSEHPLAGETLNFDVTVKAIRAATDDEKAHGHAHGEHGHGHGDHGHDH